MITESAKINGNGNPEKKDPNPDPNKKSEELLANALPVRRVKNARIGRVTWLALDADRELFSYGATSKGCLNGCLNGNGGHEARKNVDLSELLEVRQGYHTDGLHRAAREYKFQRMAPEQRCFSIIYKHPRFVCKSIDFVAVDLDQTREWMDALRELLTSTNAQNAISFNEQQWLLQNFRQADLDRNGEIAFGELWRLLKRLNLQLSEQYVQALFRESVAKSGKPRNVLSEREFLQLFSVLTELPEYRGAMRLASPDGQDFLDASAVRQFLTEEQQFKDIDEKKAQAIIDFCEPDTGTDEGQNKQKKVMTISGFRRLLQSRWGNILREGHEAIHEDMDQPLQCYYINSSHNTYLTGLQVHGNATVEGYISALRRGSRLLELDLFDGENGEPQITHKRTFISAISLRNVLKCIRNYAFLHNPYPVILTIENHVGTVQQGIMADIFQEILGEHLFVPPDDFHAKCLPSPNALRKKVLLRGKTSQQRAAADPAIASNVPDADGQREDPEQEEGGGGKPHPPVDAKFGRLIALPSVKLSPNNLYNDIKTHPYNGSPSISEGKVATYLEANAPLAAYTATRIVKSFPSGLRQNSSNMDPMPSWICGIQSAALNFQTCDADLDLNNGFFAVNGNVGYRLKPSMLREGKDPRHVTDVQCTLGLAIICAQYLPKTEPSSASACIDPYVCVQIFGVPRDQCKAHTRAVRNNGFNPVWNENFAFQLCCPELAVLRVCVKDFDRTSSDDFVGEFTVPVSSIRPGYSHVRLNTGVHHHPDEAASIFIRTAFS